MSNKLRREVEWIVGDNTYTLRLTMNDLAIIEQTPVGREGVVSLFNRMVVENRYGLAEVATVLQRGLSTGMPNRKWTSTEVYALIDEADFVDSAQIAIALLTKRLTKAPLPEDREDGQKGTDPLVPTTPTLTGSD